jgi:radical SAM superfamily enzyme YgiQ (UPF0313 family)
MNVLFVVHDCLTMPLGIGYLAAVAKQAGHTVRLGVLLHDDIVSIARSFSADIVGFTATTGFHRKYLELARALKRSDPERLVVMGGPHPTFFPEVLEENDSVDAICRGEGEEAFVEFLDALDRSADHTRIRNFWVRSSGSTIVRNDLRPWIKNLDTLPFPDRSLYAPYGSVMTFKTPFVMAGRGCPYRCSYCFNHAYNKLYDFETRVVRRRSVDNVIEELLELQRTYPVELVVFQDDIFILDDDWILEFARKYRDEIGLPFHCHFRANLVTQSTVHALADAGCISIKMAIESADEHIRNDVLKRGMSTEQILQAAHLVKEAGIVLVTQNILGNPGETIDQAFATLDLNLRCKPSYAFATLLQPYPRTEIGEFARAKGLLEAGHGALDHESFFDRSILSIDHRGRMERIRMLFPLAVEWPLIRRLLPFLSRLPLNPLYAAADKLWKGYAVKHREMPYRLTLGEYLRSLRTYLATGYY